MPSAGTNSISKLTYFIARVAGTRETTNANGQQGAHYETSTPSISASGIGCCRSTCLITRGRTCQGTTMAANAIMIVETHTLLRQTWVSH
jgi:hypothetical protein